MAGQMAWIDYALLAVVLLSALLGLFRGFVKEVFSLGSWVLSLWAALRFGETAAGHLQAAIGIEALRHAAGFAVVFAAVLILASLVGRVLAALVRTSILGGTDRSLGVLFGLLRGVVLALVLVELGGLTPLAEDPAWRASPVVAQLREAADRIMVWSGWTGRVTGSS
ncbi:MAG TPA: CvpA family protein [Gammaproteobacteria bacterium]|nr:CvpA family protein [Gammaproteobacteria bacterium]